MIKSRTHRILISDSLLLINDINVFDYFNSRELSFLIDITNDRLDHDFVRLYKEVEYSKYANFLTYETWNEVYQDDLVNLHLYYFLDTLIEKLIDQSDDSNILVSLDIILPSKIGSFLLKKYSGIIKVKQIESFFSLSYLKRNFSPIGLFFNVFRSKLKQSIKGATWLSSSINPNKNRYKDLLVKLNIENYVYFNSFFKTVKAVPNLDFNNYIKFNDIVGFFRIGNRIFNTLNNVKSNSLLFSYLNSMNLMHFGGMYVKEQLVSRAIIDLKPNSIFYTTALNFPPARLMSRLAFNHGVNFYIVACRPMLTRKRLEERVTPIDKNLNKTSYVNGYIVWDKYSKITLINQGIDPNTVYVRQMDFKRDRIYNKSIKNYNLILFTHDVKLNDSLISLFNKVDTSGKWAIRAHPLCSLTSKQLDRINSLFPNYIDISESKLYEIDLTNVVTFSINSTAAVECSSYGSAIVWLPFLNYKSILLLDVMDSIGEIINSFEELTTFMNSLKSKHYRFNLINNSLKAYDEYFLCEDQIYEFKIN